MKLAIPIAFLLCISALAQTPIRISGDSSVRNPSTVIDSNTLQSVQWVRGDSLTIELGLFDRGLFVSNNISRFTNINLEVFAGQNDTNPPMMSQSITNTFVSWGTNWITNCTLSNWTNGPTGSTNENVIFSFSAAQTAIDLNSQASQSYWMRVYGVTTDSVPRVITYLEAPVTVYDGPISATYAGPAFDGFVTVNNSAGLVSPTNLWTENVSGIENALIAVGFIGAGGGNVAAGTNISVTTTNVGTNALPLISLVYAPFFNAINLTNLDAAQLATNAAYNAKHYGATGNGSTDDTAALQAWIAASFFANGSGQSNAHALFLPAGRYVISHPLCWTNVYGAEIYGEGCESSVLVWAGTNTVTNTPALQFVNCYYPHVHDLQIYAQDGGGGPTNLTLQTGILSYNDHTLPNAVYGQCARIERIVIGSPTGQIYDGIEWGHGLGTDGNDDFPWFENVIINNYMHDGWELNRSQIYDAQFWNCQGYGMQLNITNRFGNYLVENLQGNFHWHGGLGANNTNAIFYFYPYNGSDFSVDGGSYVGNSALFNAYGPVSSQVSIDIANVTFQTGLPASSYADAMANETDVINYPGASGTLSIHDCNFLTGTNPVIYFFHSQASPFSWTWSFDRNRIYSGNQSWASLFPAAAGGNTPTSLRDNLLSCPNPANTQTNIIPSPSAWIAPSIPLTGAISNSGGIYTTPFTTVPEPAITTVGTAGSTTWSYCFTLVSGPTETPAGPTNTITTGNASLTVANYNQITVEFNEFIQGVSAYNVYRVAGGSSQGYIGTINAGFYYQVVPYLDDSNLVAGTSPQGNSMPPTVNNTGNIQMNGALVAVQSNSFTLNAGNTVTGYGQFTGAQPLRLSEPGATFNYWYPQSSNTTIWNFGATNGLQLSGAGDGSAAYTALLPNGGASGNSSQAQFYLEGWTNIHLTAADNTGLYIGTGGLVETLGWGTAIQASSFWATNWLGGFTGNGFNLTNLNATNLIGVIQTNQFGIYPSANTFLEWTGSAWTSGSGSGGGVNVAAGTGIATSTNSGTVTVSVGGSYGTAMSNTFATLSGLAAQGLAVTNWANATFSTGGVSSVDGITGSVVVLATNVGQAGANLSLVTNGSTLILSNNVTALSNSLYNLTNGIAVNGTTATNVFSTQTALALQGATLTNVTQPTNLGLTILSTNNGLNLTNLQNASIVVATSWKTNGFTAGPSNMVYFLWGTNAMITNPPSPPVGTTITFIMKNVFGSAIVTNSGPTVSNTVPWQPGGVTNNVTLGAWNTSSNLYTEIYDGQNW